MRSKYAPRPEGKKERFFYDLSGHLGCMVQSLVLALVLTFLPALFLEWLTAWKAPFFALWAVLTALLTLAIFGWWTRDRIKTSRQCARQWREAGLPEIEVQVHWFAEWNENPEVDDEISDIDPESYITLLRIVDLPGESFPTIENIVTGGDWETMMKTIDQGFDQTRLIRFPAEKPPAKHLKPGAKLEFVLKATGAVEGTGQILTVRHQ